VKSRESKKNGLHCEMTFSLANEFRFCQETIFDSISEECLCFIQKGLQYQYLDLVARKVGSTRVNDKHKQGNCSHDK
jgi:hypothetical protein